jgi:N-acetylglucosaminyldiphosphoundecaprenol N-acetyl-beta-D-mannosaminyltransferase
MFEGTDIHGLFINKSTIQQAINEIETLIENNQKGFVCFFEANLFYCALKNKQIKEIINHAALTYPDGISPAICASFKTNKRFNRVSGPTFLLKACEYGQKKKWRHFFLGGGEGVAERMANELKKKYPDMEIAGYYSPPFRELTDDDNRYIKKIIEDAKTDLLWVGLGGPKQEIWMDNNLDKINVQVMLGVGAAFDFHSRNKPWAPWIIRRLGLEWLWRMLSGGKRTFIRNIKCTFFIGLVLLYDRIRCSFLFNHHKELLKKRLCDK